MTCLSEFHSIACYRLDTPCGCVRTTEYLTCGRILGATGDSCGKIIPENALESATETIHMSSHARDKTSKTAVTIEVGR